MTARRIWLIIVLMSAALLGIIMVQAYWINNAISLRKTIFSQQVSEALITVADKMENEQAAKVISQHMDILLFQQMALGPIDTLIGGAAIIHDSIVREFVKLEASDFEQSNPTAVNNVVYETQSEFVEHAAEEEPLDIISPIDLESTIYPEDLDGGSLLMQMVQDAEQQIIADINQFNTVIKKMMVEFISQDMPHGQLIDPDLLDSLLAYELDNRGINTPYRFAVISKEHELMEEGISEEDRDEILTSDFRVKLSKESFLSRPDELFVSFPEEKNYVLGSIWTLLMGSMLFTLVIILGFSYTIYIIFRQKNLSDIKTDFINNMTHEFKTPIATISLAVDSMNNPAIISDVDKIKRYSGIIRDENNRMNGQVEKVLQMALLDRNEIRLSKEPIDLHELVVTAVETIMLQVKSRAGNIEVELDATETEFEGDELHLINVICNLLDNANKYSPENPAISLRTWNDRKWMYLSIADKGIGMNKDTTKRIFEKFYRTPKGNKHDVKGFGLGLSYVKAILDAHEGEIQVISQIDRGSTFTLQFPIER